MITEQEKLHLAQVLAQLKDAKAKLEEGLEQSVRDIEEMHEYYWKNYNEFDEYGYEDFDNRQNLLTAVNAKSEQLKTLQMYRRMMDSPYFGRVDFYYDEEDEEETYYIGIGNFSPDFSKVPLIFDWRAPVSGLFYDFDKGPAYFDAPGGRMLGSVTKKKQYQIKRGELLGEFESDIKIDDEILIQELSRNTDARLKSIVTSIQREQNRIIRSKNNEILVVQGSAGSGKTSIALHRVAYLLYHNRNKLKAEQVLILSPSSIFSDYISHILPELGEEMIREMSFDEFAWRELKEYGETEDRYDYVERVLAGGETEEMRLRGTKAFAEDIREFVLLLEQDIVSFRDLKYKKMSVTADELADYFYIKFPDIPILKRMEAIGEYLIGQQESIEDRDFDELETAIVYEKLNRMYKTRSVLQLYHDFLQEKNLLYRDDMIAFEDVFPMLYMKYCLVGSGMHRRMKHVVIDEMQDYTYLQYLIMQQIFRCPMTILGDREQTLTDRKEDTVQVIREVFGKKAETAVLKKSYRSNYEIASFAASLIGQTDLELYPRHGEGPTWQVNVNREKMAESIMSQIALESEYDTFGVICRDAKQAESFYHALKQFGEVTLLTKDSMHFVRGVVVTTYYLAKGLEFDAVFVPFAIRPENASALDKQIMYLAATRALHRLHFYQIGEDS